MGAGVCKPWQVAVYLNLLDLEDFADGQMRDARMVEAEAEVERLIREEGLRPIAGLKVTRISQTEVIRWVAAQTAKSRREE